jgi:hypothetical protein
MANARSKLKKMGNPSSVRLLTLPPCTFGLEPYFFSYLVICEQPQLSDYQEGLKKQQLVFEFDVKTWEVGHPMLP